MIDFSKDADKSILSQRAASRAEIKKTKHTDEKVSLVDYDFADRDVTKQAQKTVHRSFERKSAVLQKQTGVHVETTKTKNDDNFEF